MIPKCSNMVGNNLGISQKRHGLGVSKSEVRVRVKARAIRRGFDLCECLLVRRAVNCGTHRLQSCVNIAGHHQVD